MPKPEGRAIAVAELLRSGWAGGAVSAMLEVTDRGGSMQEALAAAEKAQSLPAGSRLDELAERAEGETNEIAELGKYVAAADYERVEKERDEAIDARREIESKLESGYSFCHPENDCAGQRAWLKAAAERDELLAGIEAVQAYLRCRRGDPVSRLYALADRIKGKGGDASADGRADASRSCTRVTGGGPAQGGSAPANSKSSPSSSKSWSSGDTGSEKP